MDVIDLDNIGEEGREEKDQEETSFSENTKDNYDNTRSQINSEPATQSETRTDLEDFDTEDLTRRIAKGQQDIKIRREGARQILKIITKEEFGDYGDSSEELLDGLSEAKFNEKGKLTALKFKGKDVRLTVKGLVNKTATVQNGEILKAIEGAKAEYEKSADSAIDRHVGFHMSDEGKCTRKSYREYRV